ncbi:MAG: carboxypeptidase regulatory-like domain-containing protein [Fimbriimonadaceae bacterium]|nr:carboxypeptidase regulatory-like domain-containing protein [Chitinophagales bacterium]
MKPKIIISILFFFFSSIVFAQNSGEIIGKLIDSVTLEPLIGAGISLEQNGKVIMQLPSEDNGAFYFKPLAPGSYTIKISTLGYRPMEIQNVYVSNTDITYLDLKMNSTSFIFDKPFVVNWIDERTIINKIPIIDQKKIKESPDRGFIEIVVKNVPAVYNQDGGDEGGIYIAGSRADATLYVIDGVRVDGSAFVPKSAILEIAVYTAGIPAKYGDVTGGVIEITTKSIAGIY